MNLDALTETSKKALVKLLEKNLKNLPEDKEELASFILDRMQGACVDGYIEGYANATEQLKKANKISMGTRTIFTVVLAPLFISVGAKFFGTNFLALVVGGVAAALLFFLADEAVESLMKLLKEKLFKKQE